MSFLYHTELNQFHLSVFGSLSLSVCVCFFSSFIPFYNKTIIICGVIRSLAAVWPHETWYLLDISSAGKLWSFGSSNEWEEHKIMWFLWRQILNTNTIIKWDHFACDSNINRKISESKLLVWFYTSKGLFNMKSVRIRAFFAHSINPVLIFCDSLQI